MVRRTSLILSEVLAGLLAGLVALTGLAAWRLHSGPIPLDFLTPHLEEALNTGRGGRVDIDHTVAVWAGWRNAIDIRATNVSVTGPDGAPLAWVPELSLGLSLRALVRGKLAPTSLDALRPSIRIVRLVSGEFSLGFGAEGGDTSPAAPGAGNQTGIAGGTQGAEKLIGVVIGELLSDPDPSRALGYLRRVSVIDARVVFEDRLAGTYFRSPAAEVVLLKNREGVVGDVQLPLQYDDRRADIRVRLDLGRETRGYKASLDFRDIELAAFAPSFPEMAPLAAFHIPLHGNVTVLGGLDGSIDRIAFDLAGGGGKLDLKELYREPLEIGSLRLRGTVQQDFRQIVLDEATVDLNGPTVSASGSLSNNGEQSSIGLSGRLEGMPMAELERFWPPSLAPAPRKWVTEHMRNGRTDVATIDIALRRSNDGSGTVTLDTLKGTLQYTNLSVDYLAPMPAVTGIDGQGTYDKDGLYLGVTGGNVSDGVQITGGQVDITGLSRMGPDSPSRIVIDAHTEGGIRAAMQVLDHEPLGLGAKLGFQPDKLDGSMQADIQFKFPLIRTLTPDMLAISTTADLRDASVSRGPFGLKVSGGALKLDLTEEQMVVSGNAELNGVPTKIDWSEHFRGTGEFQRRFTVAGRFGDADRKALGLPDLSHWLDGPAATQVTYTVYPDADNTIAISSDLKGCLVKIPELGWSKAVAKPGKLNIAGTIPESGGLTFQSFRLVTDDLDGRLKITFRPDMSDIEKVTVERAVYRGSDIRGTISRQEGGGYRIDVEGNRIDVRHFLEMNDGTGGAGANRDASLSDAGGETVPFYLKARFKEAVTGENRSLHDAQFVGRYDGRNWRLASLDAQLDQGAALTLRYEPDGTGAYDLSVESHDAGQALRTFDWFNEIQGGSLVIQGRRETVDGPTVGTFTVKDYRLVESPAGLRLLQLLTVVGLPAAVASKGVNFVSLDGSYSYHDGVLTLGGVETFGASTGIKIDKGGWLDFNRDAVDVQGVVIPAYAAQGVIGKIPLIGDIITGGEGLVATNFRIVGKLGEPDIKVNPLSTLPLPGFLRKLFRVRPKPADGQGGGEEQTSPRATD